MAVTEECPDGQGGFIQRRIGVQMWEKMLADLPEPPRDMVLDPPTPERALARGKKARAKEEKEREREKEKEGKGKGKATKVVDVDVDGSDENEDEDEDE